MKLNIFPLDNCTGILWVDADEVLCSLFQVVDYYSHVFLEVKLLFPFLLLFEYQVQLFFLPATNFK